MAKLLVLRSVAIAEKLNTPEKVLKSMEKDLYPNIYVFYYFWLPPFLLLAVNVKGLLAC